MSRLVLPKFAFLMHIPEMHFHYRPVLELLDDDSYDILLPDDPSPVLLEIVDAFEYNYVLISELIESRTMYRYLVSDHIFLQDYTLLQNIGDIQIRFFSEYGYDRLNLGNQNRFYDLALCIGRFQADKLHFCQQTRFFTIGWPRLDAWYGGLNLDLNELLESLNCDRYRPVLVWTPTFGELSSIDAYANKLGSLIDRYNIVVKPHDYTILEEPERLELLQDQRFQALIIEPYDELLLYVVADFVLADYGASPFGAVFTDQRMVLLNLPEAGNHQFTGFNSSDVQMRNYYPSIDKDDSPAKLVEILEGPDVWRATSRHNRMRDRFFAPNYGRAAVEAAGVLKNIEQYI